MGEGFLRIPYGDGFVIRKVKFSMIPDLPIVRMPTRDLPQIDFAQEAACYATKHGTDDSPKADQKGSPTSIPIQGQASTDSKLGNTASSENAK